MSKKRGFTLTEVLVVIAVTTLVLALVGGTLVFMTESCGRLIEKSEELLLVSAIEDSMRKQFEDGQIAHISLSDGNIKRGDTVLFKDTGVSQILFNSAKVDNGDICLVRCTLTFTNSSYSFIIGTTDQEFSITLGGN